MSDLSLFAYGSLQRAPVFSAVTGLQCVGHPARLKGYRCHHLKGFTFPAIVACPGAEVSGLFYPALGPSIFRRLDAFEDDFYERQSVVLAVEGLGERVAEAYVIRSSALDLLGPADWNLSLLTEEAIAALLERLELPVS